jgi:hypothetical protein
LRRYTNSGRISGETRTTVLPAWRWAREMEAGPFELLDYLVN